MEKMIFGVTDKNDVFKITISHSYVPENPLHSRKYLGKLAIKVPKYDFRCPTPEEELARLAKKEGVDSNLNDTWKMLELENSKGYAIRSVYIYENKDKFLLTTKNTAGPLDYTYGGVVGFIYLSPNAMDGHSRAASLRKLDDTIEAINLYRSGDVYDAQVEKLKNPEISLLNNAIAPEWETTIYGCTEYIGRSDELVKDLARNLDIAQCFDTMADATAHILRKANVKTYNVKVTRVISHDFAVIANSQADAEKTMADAHLTFDLVCCKTDSNSTDWPNII